MKHFFLDFEFTDSNEPNLNLICCSYSDGTRTKSLWLQDSPDNKKALKKTIIKARDLGYIFVAYSVVAEARCFLELGVDPVTCKWIDLHLEDKMFTNSNQKWGYGKQKVKGRLITTTNATKWGKTEEELRELNMSKPERSYSAACYRYLKENIDNDRKNRIRDLIINKKRGFSENEKEEIVEYCESDVVYLSPMLKVMNDYYLDFFDKSPEVFQNMRRNMTKFQLKRGEYAALTALMEQKGYPVHPVYFKNFIKNSPNIIHACQVDIASQFDKYKPFTPKKVYKTKPDSEELKMNQGNIREWIINESGVASRWTRTSKDFLSLSKDSWNRFYSYSHTYERGDYPAQIVRFLKLKESMNGFLPGSKRKITDSLGKDGRVRPYMNIFGSQSARSQPGSVSFIPLKAAWSRALIYPTTSKTFMCGIDYSSQEVLVQAILSNDSALFESYDSGDVYLDFAKKAGAIPLDGTREEYKKERNLFKATFLGIGYGMQSKSLARKLTEDTKEEVTEERAVELIDTFFEVYSDYAKYLKKVSDNYINRKFVALPCGWVMFGQNLNIRSIRNMPVQGAASSIMREAVKLCYDKGVEVTYTLHDALYAELTSLDQIDIFKRCMIDAFKNILDHKYSEAIRVDIDCWGSFFNDKQIKRDDIKIQDVYIDERAKKDFDFFKPYFTN